MEQVNVLYAVQFVAIVVLFFLSRRHERKYGHMPNLWVWFGVSLGGALFSSSLWAVAYAVLAVVFYRLASKESEAYANMIATLRRIRSMAGK